jgi:dipeptidyl aminopeptidase/acylaminoacyl peptidase
MDGPDEWYTRNGIPDPLRGATLLVTETSTGRTRDLTGPRGVSWGGEWSPDSRQLAFMSDRDGVPQLWIWDVTTDRVRRVAADQVRPCFSFEVVQWTPDGRFLVAKLRPLTGPLAVDPVPVRYDSAAPTFTVFKSSGGSQPEGPPDSSLLPAFTADLAIVNVATGEVRRLVTTTPIRQYWVAPGGRAIAYIVAKPARSVASEDLRYDLVVVSLPDGQSRTLAPSIPEDFGTSVSWSPDGSALAYTIWAEADTVRQDCYVVEVNGGPPRNVTPGKHPPFGTDYGPAWSPRSDALYLIGADTVWRASANGGDFRPFAVVPGHSLNRFVGPPASGSVWAPGGRGAFYVVTLDTASEKGGVARIDGETGKDTLLFEEEARVRADIVAAGRVVVYRREGASTPPDLWIGGVDFAGRRRLTHANPVLDSYKYGETRLVSWHSDDGAPLLGALILPPRWTPGHPIPLVVEVYAGWQLSHYRYDFGIGGTEGNVQLFATRGYAVFLPDAPVHPTTPYADLGKTVLPGVERVVEMGIADPDRLGVLGISYGGYSTVALITQTPRFKVAVDIVGVSANLFTKYGQLRGSGFDGVAYVESGQGRMRASPWERTQRYIANSPYFALDRVATPLLILQGTRDRVAPSYGSDELFIALRRLGMEVEYARYEGEGHAIDDWRPSNQRDFYTRMFGWLDRHLRPEMTAGASATGGSK